MGAQPVSVHAITFGLCLEMPDIINLLTASTEKEVCRENGDVGDHIVNFVRH